VHHFSKSRDIFFVFFGAEVVEEVVVVEALEEELEEEEVLEVEVVEGLEVVAVCLASPQNKPSSSALLFVLLLLVDDVFVLVVCFVDCDCC
jgi:hypothetical protein